MRDYLEPVMNSHTSSVWRSAEESESGIPEDAVYFHLGFLMMLRAEIHPKRLVKEILARG